MVTATLTSAMTLDAASIVEPAFIHTVKLVRAIWYNNDNSSFQIHVYFNAILPSVVQHNGICHFIAEPVGPEGAECSVPSADKQACDALYRDDCLAADCCWFTREFSGAPWCYSN